MKTVGSRKLGGMLACSDKVSQVLVKVFDISLHLMADMWGSVLGAGAAFMFLPSGRVMSGHNAICIPGDSSLAASELLAGDRSFSTSEAFTPHQEHLAAMPSRAHWDYHGASTQNTSGNQWLVGSPH